MIRGTLSSLAPRISDALHLRFAWHSAAGALKAAQALNALNVSEVAARLADAQQAAEAAEPLRREEAVLRAKLAKLEGKLQAISELRPLALAHASSTTLLDEVGRSLSRARLVRSRLSLKLADLRLVMMRYDRAQANVHAAGGALIAIKRLQASIRRAVGDEARLGVSGVAPDGSSEESRARQTPWPPASSGLPAHWQSALSATAAATVPTGPTGIPTGAEGSSALSNEVRGFVRGCLAPMLKAAMAQTLLRRPSDPLAFLSEWFWQHSALHAYEEAAGGRQASRTARDVDVRRREVGAAQEELARATCAIVTLLDAGEQTVGANSMLQRMLSKLPQREILFNQVAQLMGLVPASAGTGGGMGAGALSRAVAGPREPASDESSVSAAWSVRHSNQQTAFANDQLLDCVAAVLRYYPLVMLQVHVPIPDARRLPASLVGALLPLHAGGGSPAERVRVDQGSIEDDPEAVRAVCGKLARRRAQQVVNALRGRGVPARQMVATSPGFDLGLQSSGQLTLHERTGELHAPAAHGRGAAGEDAPPAAAAAPADGTGSFLGTRARSSPAANAAGHPTHSEVALAHLRSAREEALAQTQRELRELLTYTAQMPALALPQPVTLIASVAEISAPAAVEGGAGSSEPVLCVWAFGMERANGNVAAFEVHDTALDEVDLEVWAGTVNGGPATHLVGTCAVSALSLLVGASATMIIALPLCDAVGVVVGTARVMLEVRPAHSSLSMSQGP